MTQSVIEYLKNKTHQAHNIDNHIIYVCESDLIELMILVRQKTT